LSRSGPTVPVAFAGLKVWHEAQPFAAKTALPAAASPPPPEDVVVLADVVLADVVVSEEVVPDEVVVGVDVEPIATVRVTVSEESPSEV
jgi:hypothetical protein